MTTQDSQRSAEASGADSPEAPTTRAPGGERELVPPEAVMDYKARWEAIQQGFVDDPRVSVSAADGLVSDVLEKLSNGFDEQHGELERQWNEGEPDTEDLRAAFQRYRDFFDRLLSI